jgi:DNA-binding PadR family transcriptional regulator
VPSKTEDSDRDLYSGLIRLHILHHAVEAPIFGLGIRAELARHGYRISPGTLYPLLNGLEKKGYLRSWEERDGKSRRRVFRATPRGKQALRAVRAKIRGLFAEIVGLGQPFGFGRSSEKGVGGAGEGTRHQAPWYETPT